MCTRDHDDLFRRGRKKMAFDEKEDKFEANFKTSMLFTKSMKAL